MRKVLSWAVFLITLLAVAMATGWSRADSAHQAQNRPKPTAPAQALRTTADHTRHPALQQVFKSGRDVTAACLSCHSEAEKQFKQTIHWTWIGYTDEKGKRLGKAGDSLNNFCLSANNMQDKACNSCHPGWQDRQQGVNCLTCHGRKPINWSEAFEDYNAFADSDDPEEIEIAAEIQAEIQAAARSIGLPTRENCGECHFKGGGGDGVKHGDLDTSLTRPEKTLDVHMGMDGQNFACTRCHTTVRHVVAGRIYSKPAFEERTSLIQDDLSAKITCESCHGATPHQPGHKADDHTDKVACQSCHIPSFARALPTKMSWDWSQAGRLKDGRKYAEKDSLGKETYLSIKGAMRWEQNVRPEYAWFNGSMRTLTVKDTIDPSATVPVAAPAGSPGDAASRIFPFKIHQGRQPYDKVHKNLLAPLLSGPDGYWTTLNWPEALSRGMQFSGVPFSGEFDFVDSTYAMPTTHMVAPKENAVSCTECHVGKNSRLADVPGVYMPARDRSRALDSVAWVVVLASLLGVSLHVLGRIFSNGRHRNEV